ncbi:MAG TPA: hypothetical protein DCQ92_08765 [Verrucomicrobia subdivision 3 bacterium]|nr:hypothetical protein [Limisphaerales bacterium]
MFWAEQISFLCGIYSFSSNAVTIGICLLLIPLWSFFFGWIFVKLDNWLNHFPVLGKRVF